MVFRTVTVSAYFRANRLKLCGNCAFPQNFNTRKSGEITRFFAVDVSGKELITEITKASAV